MSSCENCIHYGFCPDERMNAIQQLGLDICCKDKSNFIEPPCPIGSTVYMVVNAQNTWDDVAYRAVLPVQFKLDMLQSFNKRFFLTQMEAEKKLDEMV